MYAIAARALKPAAAPPSLWVLLPSLALVAALAAAAVFASLKLGLKKLDSMRE